MPAATANANAKKPPPPTLPVDLDWIGVETGSARLAPPPADTSARNPAMNGSSSSNPSQPTGDTEAAGSTPGDPVSRGPEPAASDPFALPKRPSFKANTQLTAKDLTNAIGFLDAVQNKHNLYLHDWGIASGLSVSIATAATGLTLQVEPGLAIDNTGREFLLDTSYKTSAPADAVTGTGTWFLVLHAPQDAGALWAFWPGEIQPHAVARASSSLGSTSRL